MRIMKILAAALLLAGSVAAGANAATVNFNGYPQFTSNPAEQGISFWGGDPGLLHDTYTDDAWTPGNMYLANGIADSLTPRPMDTFIGVSLAPNTGSAFFDIVSENQFPGGTNLQLLALLGGTTVGEISLLIGDNLSHHFGITAGGAFDTLYIFDDVNSSGLGESFHIDNFVTTAATDPGPGTVPEPSTIVLLLSGLAGTFIWRRNKKP